MTELGLSSGLPTYERLVEASHGTRRSYFRMKPSVAVSDWSAYSGNCYVALVDRNYRGQRRDVVAVQVLDTAPLTRVESKALCVATANSFFYAPDEKFSETPARWDSSYWDIGTADGVNPEDSHYWDQFAQLYVNLDGTDPETTSVLAELGFYIAQNGEIHPELGPDLLADGAMEYWVDAYTPSGWIASGVASGAVRAEALEEGSYSLQLVGAGSVVYDTASLQANCVYRVSGTYETEEENGDGDGYIRVQDVSETLDAQQDGRNWTASAEVPLKTTRGQSRRFFFDFLARGGDTRLFLGHGSELGSTKFDDVSFRRVWRYVTYEPRIAKGDIPPSSQRSPGIFFSGVSVGSGEFSFRNEDGAFDLPLGQLTWIGHEVEHYVGGFLPEAGTLDRAAWDRRFTGLIQDAFFDDEHAWFPLEDARTRFHKDLPPNFLDTLDTTIEERVRGNPKPLLFGGKTLIRPPRIGFESGGLYGKYLVADCADAPNGIYAVDIVRAYESEDAALKVDSTARFDLQQTGADLAPEFKPYVGIASFANPTDYQTTVTKDDLAASWTDNVCVSKQVLHGDGYVEFRAGGATTTLLCVGLAQLDAQQLNYTDIDYGFYLNASAEMHAYENGSDMEGPETYNGNTIFRVVRSGSTITYQYDLNGTGSWTTLYTSLVASSGPLAVKVAINTNEGVAVGITCSGFGQVDSDLTTGEFEVLEDVRPIRIDLDKQFLNFDVGGSELTATVPTGLYSIRTLSCEIAHQMKQQTGASALACYYTDSTGLVTISAPSGTLNLRITNGTNKDASLWGVIGFSRDANDTGATSYSSDEALWDANAIDSKHILRVSARGYKDDASGTVTGTANALIERGCDIARALVLYWLKRSAEDIDSVTFLAARSSAPESLAIYLDTQESSQTIFEKIENSNLATIVVGGDGKIYYKVYTYTDSWVAPLSSRIEERDYLAKPVFGRKTEEVFRSVTVNFDQRPDNKNWRFESVTDPSVANTFKRIQSKPFDTYVRFRTTAKLLAPRLLVLAQRPPLRVELLTSAKLFKKKVGDIIQLTRRRAPTVEGTVAQKAFRIISIDPDPIGGKVEAGVVAAVELPVGVDCAGGICQQLCQLETQDDCNAFSQADCTGGTQQPCNLSCQVCGEAGRCQTCGQSDGPCQDCVQLVGCQTCGEAAQCMVCGQVGGTCQVACEGLGCQICGQVGFCQVCGQASNCQLCGQAANCQTCTQGSACQACGESGFCQTCGEGVGCETCGEAGENCEVCGETGGYCMVCGQIPIACQTNCLFACQTCQTNCQVTVEECILHSEIFIP